MNFYKIKKAFSEHRWQDIVDRIDRDSKDVELSRLLEKAKYNIKYPAPDKVGVAKALFYNETEDRGQCIPVTLIKKRPQGTGKDYGLASKNANDAVFNLIGTTNYTKNPEIFIAPESYGVSSEIDTLFFPEGESIGLTAAIILLSTYLKKKIPSKVAFSAEIDSHGNLHPVKHIQKKIESVERNCPHVNKIFVAMDQKEVKNRKNVVCCSSLEEVVKEVWGETFYITNILSQRESIEVQFEQFEYLRKLQNYPAIRMLARDLIAKLSDAQKASHRTYLVYVLSEMGLQLTHDGKGEEARKYFKDSIKLMEELGENIDSRIRIFDPFVKYGVLLTDLYLFTEAEKMFQKAIKLANEYKYAAYHKIGLWNSIGQLYAKQLKYKQANDYLTESLTLALDKDTCEYDNISRLYCYLAENEMLSGNFESANIYLNLADDNLKHNLPVQKFFNTFWRLYLLFSENKASAFFALFTEFQHSDWVKFPKQNQLHLGIVYGFAAVLYRMNGKEDLSRKYSEKAKKYIFYANDIFSSLNLVKLEAIFLSQSLNTDPIFFDRKDILRLFKKAEVQNKYFTEILESLRSMSNHDPSIWFKISQKLVI